jgi:hypothetical protein
MERPAHRVASVTSVRPARRSAPIARLRRAAITLGPDRVLTLDLSSWYKVSRPAQGLDRPLFPDVPGQAPPTRANMPKSPVHRHKPGRRPELPEPEARARRSPTTRPVRSERA